MNITELHVGSTFELDGKLYVMIEYQRVSRPRLAALIRTKFKNIETGQVLERNFGPTDTVGDAFIERKEMQFLYSDEDFYHFMDPESYEQAPLNKQDVGENAKYIKEGMMVTIHQCKGKILDVVPPLFVEMLITKCDPAVAGDTARSANKPATLENGSTVKVPMFVEEGEIIKIDTRTGEYVERVKK